jgi:hypothetical protein
MQWLQMHGQSRRAMRRLRAAPDRAKLEVAGDHGRRAVTTRLALSSGLERTGVPLDTLLAAHCRDLGARGFAEREAAEQRRLEKERARLRALVRQPLAVSRVRRAMGLRQPRTKEQLEQDATDAWRDEDKFNLVAGAARRSGHLEAGVRRAQAQLPPLLKNVFAVRLTCWWPDRPRRAEAANMCVHNGVWGCAHVALKELEL